MYKNIFDSHAHYTDKAFNIDRSELLGSFKESGICGIINCGADLESSKESAILSSQYDFMYFACGIHPEEVDNLPSDYLDTLKALSKDKKCVAIGEIGLDYYWRQDNKDLQKMAKKGNVRAKLAIAKCYLNGSGISKNVKLAADYFVEIADDHEVGEEAKTLLQSIENNE